MRVSDFDPGVFSGRVHPVEQELPDDLRLTAQTRHQRHVQLLVTEQDTGWVYSKFWFNNTLGPEFFTFSQNEKKASSNQYGYKNCWVMHECFPKYSRMATARMK